MKAEEGDLQQRREMLLALYRLGEIRPDMAEILRREGAHEMFRDVEPGK